MKSLTPEERSFFSPVSRAVLANPFSDDRTAIGRSGFIPFDPETGRLIESFPDIFIALNLSRYSEALIESELFGHKKGAFTGPGMDYPWPGNVRELEQCARRILLNQVCRGDTIRNGPDSVSRLRDGILTEDRDAATFLSEYRRLLHERLGSYEAVARRTLPDRRTVKKYMESRKNPPPGNSDGDP